MCVIILKYLISVPGIVCIRYRRNTMVKMGEATVIALPPSIAQDPTSFVPPSQYEVRVLTEEHACLEI